MEAISSKNMRDNPLFMRNNYAGSGRWNIPQVKKQKIDTNNISLIACSDTKSHDKGDSKNFPVEKFLNAKLWNNKIFWDVESEMEWVDA